MNHKQRERKHNRRKAHADRRDNRRPDLKLTADERRVRAQRRRRRYATIAERELAKATREAIAWDGLERLEEPLLEGVWTVTGHDRVADRTVDVSRIVLERERLRERMQAANAHRRSECERYEMAAA